LNPSFFKELTTIGPPEKVQRQGPYQVIPLVAQKVRINVGQAIAAEHAMPATIEMSEIANLFFINPSIPGAANLNGSECLSMLSARPKEPRCCDCELAGRVAR
jgi:hypothetical protein